MNNVEALVIFNVFVVAMLALDLGTFHRRAHEVTFREAALWSACWIVLSLGVSVVVYFWRGPQPALEFLTAYVLEKSLALDNLAVFGLIFAAVAVPLRLQYRVLFWGAMGALVMRALFILPGAALIARFEWVVYIFGGILVLTGARLLRQAGEKPDSGQSGAMRLVRRLLPVTSDYEGSSFFLRRKGQLLATPLLAALLMIEFTDVLFAVDSIPAVFTVTRDSFIAFSSNILAVLGLRSLYFLLAGSISKIRHLRAGLSIVLIFLGAKMLMEYVYEIPVGYSLLVISVILAATIVLSCRSEQTGASPKTVGYASQRRSRASGAVRDRPADHSLPQLCGASGSARSSADLTTTCGSRAVRRAFEAQDRPSLLTQFDCAVTWFRDKAKGSTQTLKRKGL